MIDLHTHSRISDGSESPTRVVELAAEVGATAIALTDHDTLAGLDEAIATGGRVGVEVIPGVEVSCQYKTGTMHMLIYFTSPDSEALVHALNELQDSRAGRNQQILELMQRDGLDITMEELVAEGGATGIGKPHFAALLLRKGVVSTIQEAFDRYLEKGQRYYVDKKTFSPEEMIELALASKAIPVLAHPLTVDKDPTQLRKVIKGWAKIGLAGVEAQYGRYSIETRSFLEETAKIYNLIATGGSDFHGSYKPDLNVATGRGDLNVADNVVDRLKEFRATL
ncbi:MAG: PHP domain-containing protein [Actinomycetota bacterium]|nr:PHP domain-containing protein [Actinomycetota bacterium]